MPGSASVEYQGPRSPASTPSAVKYQIHASAMITATTTSDMTASCKTAYGKKLFPSRSTSSL